MEALAATDLLKKLGIKVWFVNVVDLLKIQCLADNDQAISDERFVEFFGDENKPVLFCFHAYEGTIHRILWDRPGVKSFRVHGYEEKGSTTTPFDMLRLNNMDRWALGADALRLVDADKYADQIQAWEDFREEAFRFAVDEGFDHPDFTNWVWPDAAAATEGELSATQMTAGDNE